MSIPKFEQFKVNEKIVAAGFGQNPLYNFSISTGLPGTGYNMVPIVGTINNAANHIADQANGYEKNDNPAHTAESYIKEAKHHLNEAIDKAYESRCGMDETKND